MRMRRLLLGTALCMALPTAAFAGTIPMGTSTGAADYFPPDSSSVGGCPCGGEISVGGTPGATGTWTMSGGQTFSLTSPVGISGSEASPYVVIGRGSSSSNGTVTLTGAGTTLNVNGDNNGMTLQVGRLGGTGVLNVHDNATLSLYDPNNQTPDSDATIHLGESGGTGTLGVNKGNVSIQTTNGAAIYVGAHNPADPAGSGTGIMNITNNSSVVLRDLDNGIANNTSQGVEFVLGQDNSKSGIVTIDHSSLLLDGQDNFTYLAVGQNDNTTAKMTMTNGATVTLTANSGGTAKGASAEADLIVGQGSGGNATLDVDGGSHINMSGPFGYVGIGYEKGSFGQMTMSGGSTFSNTASDGFVQIGQSDPTGSDSGVGKLTISGSGTKFDTVGGIGVGQYSGTGSSTGILKVENSGEVTADYVDVNSGGVLMGNGGTINAAVNLSGGVIAPGASPGTMTINGDLTSNSGLLQIQIGGIDPSLYDHLILNGDLFATTPLKTEVTFLNSFTPQIGDTFDFLQVLGVIHAMGNPFDFTFQGFEKDDFTLASSGGSFSFKTVALATTPLPATVPLFGTSLIVLGLLARRRRNLSLA